MSAVLGSRSGGSYRHGDSGQRRRATAAPHICRTARLRRAPPSANLPRPGGAPGTWGHRRQRPNGVGGLGRAAKPRARERPAPAHCLLRPGPQGAAKPRSAPHGHERSPAGDRRREPGGRVRGPHTAGGQHQERGKALTCSTAGGGGSTEGRL